MSLETVRWLTGGEIATLMGWKGGDLRRSMTKFPQLWRAAIVSARTGKRTFYDASFVEVLRAMYGQDGREVVGTDQDWLSRYLRGEA